MIPNLIAHVLSTKEKHPDAWDRATTGVHRSTDFIKLLALDCYAGNVQFGLNGKDGNKNDISFDTLNFFGAGPGRTPEGHPCTVVKVIHAENNEPPTPVWIPDPTAGGAWVDPTDGGKVSRHEPEDAPRSRRSKSADDAEEAARAKKAEVDAKAAIDADEKSEKAAAKAAAKDPTLTADEQAALDETERLGGVSKRRS